MEQEEENIEVGKTYNVRMLVARTYLSSTGRMCLRACTVDKQGHHLATHILSEGEADAFSPINLYQPIEIFKMTEIPESAPKYDPCRKFRKGDKAKPRIINGREIPKMPLDVIFTVTGDEDEYGAVPVEYMSPVRGLLTSTTVHAVWLELVTPVEKLEPYSVTSDVGGHYVCDKEGMVISLYYNNCHPNAKAAAEDERDRLNAAWKEQYEQAKSHE